MPDLITLLDQYAILESFSHEVTFGDLLALSRTSSSYRAVLHGIRSPTEDSDYIEGSGVRSSIHLGAANTGLWSLLKHNSQQVCSEPSHVKGGTPGGCRMCSMPVCGACIVRSSFKKNENTFTQRRRYFCEKCWVSNVPHQERLQYQNDRRVTLLYAKMDSCQCTAKDGVLCTQCRQELRQDDSDDRIFCAGLDCGRVLIQDTVAGRICIWCNLTLPTRSLERSWSDFEQRKCMSWEPGADAARVDERRQREQEAIEDFKRLSQTPLSTFDDQRFDARFKRRRSSQSSAHSAKASSASNRSEHTLVGDHLPHAEENVEEASHSSHHSQNGDGSPKPTKAPSISEQSEYTLVGDRQHSISEDTHPATHSL